MASNFKIEPLVHPEGKTCKFGAVITGLDLNNFTEDIVAQLEKATWEHKLIIIKGQNDLKPKRAWELLQALDPEMIIEDQDDLMNCFHPHQWFRDSFRAIKVPDGGLFYFIGKGPQDDPRYGKPGLDMGDANVSHYYSVPLSDEDFEAGRTRFHVWYMNGFYWRHDLTKLTILRMIKFPTEGLDKQTVEWADGSGMTMEVKPGTQAFLDVEQLYDMLSDEEKRMADHSWAEYNYLPFENLRDCHYAPNGLGVVTEGREQPYEELLKLGGSRKESQKKYPLVWVNPVTGKKSFQGTQHLIRRLFIRNGPDETPKIIDDLGEVRKFLDNIYTRIIRPEHIWVGPEDEHDVVIFGSHGLLHSNIDYPASWGVRTIHQAFMPTRQPPLYYAEGGRDNAKSTNEFYFGVIDLLFKAPAVVLEHSNYVREAQYSNNQLAVDFTSVFACDFAKQSWLKGTIIFSSTAGCRVRSDDDQCYFKLEETIKSEDGKSIIVKGYPQARDECTEGGEAHWG
ncbi:hypothetical protein G6011_06112 [Alternaria panax]|uniref:TauD/TfdA-like domain-containing protein n=1 Tax=Alternaria panax TaxID=48097 RepID=A0AAD4FKU7_9PLEO|nr:hypothetical protein G6011_06112 [Alternaria panax]